MCLVFFGYLNARKYACVLTCNNTWIFVLNRREKRKEEKERKYSVYVCGAKKQSNRKKRKKKLVVAFLTIHFLHHVSLQTIRFLLSLARACSLFFNNLLKKKKEKKRARIKGKTGFIQCIYIYIKKQKKKYIVSRKSHVYKLRSKIVFLGECLSCW